MYEKRKINRTSDDNDTEKYHEKISVFHCGTIYYY